MRRAAGILASIVLLAASAGAGARQAGDALTGVREAAWSPDGSHVALTLDDAIWTMAADGTSPMRLVAKPGAWIAERDEAWSRDGRAIAFSAETNGEWDIWTAPAAGGAAARVTSIAGDERWPSFTGDGRIVFSHRVGRGPWQLFVVGANGSGSPEKITPDDAAEWQARVAPNGVTIAFISDRDAGWDVGDVWVRDLASAPGDAAAPRQIRVTSTVGAESYPTWSADGARLAYDAERGGQHGIWVSPVPHAGASDAAQQLSRHAGVPAWSPDGQSLLVATFPTARTAYNGDPKRDDAEPAILPETRASYALYRVSVADGTDAPAPFPPEWQSSHNWTASFDEVWQTLTSLYYHGGDSAEAWEAARDAARPAVVAAANDAAAEDAIDALVARQPLIKTGARSTTAVATSGNPLASAAGIAILKKGGNIVDAAIAVSFALGVTEPDASSVGGDGMCLLFLKGMPAPVAIDYKDMSPGNIGRDNRRLYSEDGRRVASDGPTVSNIPGIVAGMDDLYQHYGSHKVAWADLIAPAIALADDGFVLDDALPTTVFEGRTQFAKYPESVKVFMPGGRLPKAGDRFVNKDYANTLRELAAEGGDSFYRGPLAQKIAADMDANGGIITAADLAQYHAVERAPLSGHYRGHLVYSVPAPSPNGVQMIETLQILDHYAPKPGATYANDADFLHYVIEAWRARGGDGGGRVGDPDKGPVDYGAALDPDHAAERFKLIDPTKSMAGGGRGGPPSLGAGLAPSVGRSAVTATEPDEDAGHMQTGTTSFALADTDGDMIVFTQTLSTWGGSFYVSKDLGFLYNDHFRGGGSSPHTRSSSTTVPTMLFAPAARPDDNRFGIPGFVPKMATGCAGNSWIPASVYDIVVNVIDSKMDAQHAIEAPRLLIGSGPTGARTQIEDRIPRAILADLEARGHTFQKIGRKGEVRQGYASVVILDMDKHVVEAGAEPRRSHGAVGR